MLEALQAPIPKAKYCNWWVPQTVRKNKIKQRQLVLHTSWWWTDWEARGEKKEKDALKRTKVQGTALWLWSWATTGKWPATQPCVCVCHRQAHLFYPCGCLLPNCRSVCLRGTGQKLSCTIKKTRGANQQTKIINKPNQVHTHTNIKKLRTSSSFFFFLKSA